MGLFFDAGQSCPDHSAGDVFAGESREYGAGKRLVKVTETRKKQDWSRFLANTALQYKHAEKITLIMDNLNTHVPGSLYETYAPQQA